MKRALLFLFFITTTASAQTLVPLNDLGAGDYRWGYIGGLYDAGGNTMEPQHLAAGLQQAAKIQPLDANGNPSPTGKIVFMAAGIGEASRIMCGADPFGGCEPGSLMSMAATNPNVNHDSLVLVNAAHVGFDVSAWYWPFSPNYERIRTNVLLAAGVTEKQVQAAWMIMANNTPGDPPLPIQYADAYRLKGSIAQALRAMKEHYPNLQVAYLSSRTYGGYMTSQWNAEPYAYESGLSVRWVVVAQEVEGREGSYWDTRINDIRYSTGLAPWVSWGPYLWANGTTTRADGLTWEPSDYEPNGELLSEQGAHKGATRLLDFLLHEPTAANWFGSAPVVVRARPARH